MKELKMYINGQFVESGNGKWIDVLNPSTEEVISRQPEGTIEDVEKALDAARVAQKEWAKTPVCERAVYLTKIADGIRKREQEFVEISRKRREEINNFKVYGNYRSKIKDIARSEIYEPNCFVCEEEAFVDLPF
jgi:lactaldehyde dehydrogenase/glycolaldehyde dehydrogenase